MSAHDEDALSRLIPRRLEAVEIAQWVLTEGARLGLPKPMKIYFAERLVIDGLSSAFTNPVIDAGLVHCRALLEFLGLAAKDGKLVARTNPRKADDLGIENFSNANGALPFVAPQQALERYKGDAREAERALVTVLQSANKRLAHLTTASMAVGAADLSALEIACRGVRALVVSHLYTPLGRPEPTSSIASYKPGS